MPNLFAYIALLSWPLIIFYFFRKKGIVSGILLSMLGAAMFLPAGFNIDPPLLPALDKFSITTITIMGFLILYKKQIGFSALPIIIKILFIAFLLSPFMTAMTNSERYFYLPGLSLYDGLSYFVANFLEILPFLLGAAYFQSYENQKTLFKYFSIGAVIYAVLALYEIRMSPQLSRNVYGFLSGSWLQQIREGGFRATIFMGHGLWVAFFLAMGVAFTATMYKTKTKIFQFGRNGLVLLLILVTLILSKSLASLLYGVSALIALYLVPKRLVHLGVVVIAVLFISYPVLSSLKLFPHRALVSLAESVSEERAQSLDFRFENENSLLAHANNKMMFGWGGWGRNRARDEMTGNDVSTTDGQWIITLGVYGWVGYLSKFMLIVIPLWWANKYRKLIPADKADEQNFFALHSVIVGLILVDQMPNASLNPLYWLIIGALVGRIYDIRHNSKRKTATA